MAHQYSSSMMLRSVSNNKIVASSSSTCFQILVRDLENYSKTNEVKDRYLLHISSRWDRNQVGCNYTKDDYYKNVCSGGQAWLFADKAINSEMLAEWVDIYNQMVDPSLRLPRPLGRDLIDYYEKTCLVILPEMVPAAVLASLSWYRLPLENPLLVKTFIDSMRIHGVGLIEALAIAASASRQPSDRSLFLPTTIYGRLFNTPVNPPPAEKVKSYQTADILQPTLFFHCLRDGFRVGQKETMQQLFAAEETPDPGIWKSYEAILMACASKEDILCPVEALVTREDIEKRKFSRLVSYDVAKLFKILRRVMNKTGSRIANPPLSVNSGCLMQTASV